jgi:hypothetical protein
MNYQVVTFESFDSNDAPVYHTNVMLALGTAFAVVCLESVPAGADRVALEQSLRQSGRELILITRAQMGEFCGNILELATPTGDRVLAMSTRAKAALTADQQQALGRHARIVAVPIPTIERVGGGGVRCMLAELFLPAA